MTREDWTLIKDYIDAKIDEEFDRKDENAGVWCGMPAITRAEQAIEAHFTLQENIEAELSNHKEDT